MDGPRREWRKREEGEQFGCHQWSTRDLQEREKEHEKETEKREVEESGVILALAQRPLGKSLQPTEALQAHKSPEKLRLPGPQRWPPLPSASLFLSFPSLPFLSFLSCSPFLFCSQQNQGQEAIVHNTGASTTHRAFFFSLSLSFCQ